MRRWNEPLVFLSLALLATSARAADHCLFYTSPALSEAGLAAGGVTFRGASVLEKLDIHPYRGSVVIRLVPKDAFGGYPAQVEVYPGPPHLKVIVGATHPKPDSGIPADQLLVTFSAVLDHFRDGNRVESVTASVGVAPNEPLHAAWTWSGVEHRLYLNGQLKLAKVVSSPLPAVIQPPVRILSNYTKETLDNAPIRQIAIYDFPLTADEVAQDVAGNDAQPLVAAAPHRPSLVAQFAPGEKKGYAAVDVGNELEPRTSAVRFEAVDGAGEVKAEMTAALRRGFAEAVFPIPSLAPGQWRGRAVLLDDAGQQVAVTESTPWTFPDDAPWLGNTKGLTDTIQPPWTPIEMTGFEDATNSSGRGGQLAVWGRTLDLAGGFGLPRQIVSQGSRWLAAPIALELAGKDGVLPIEHPRVTLTKAQPHAAEWKGEARAGDVRITTVGTLEYDGMMLFKLRLEPAIPGKSISLEQIRLQTLMPKEHALFLNTSTDQGYYWYPYDGWIPKQPGVVHDNLKQQAAQSSFLFYATFSDHDTGLEWFADDLAGWQVDESKPVQEVVREPDGAVRWVCHLANRPFTLTSPIEITFGYMATPTKPLPSDWRSWYCHYLPLKDIASDLAVWWLWSNSTYDKYRGGIFNLRPDDMKKFTDVVKAEGPVKPAPFVNQHVTVPCWPDSQRPEKGWPWFNNLLQAESANDGWVAVPTRGVRDYWAHNLDQWIASGSMRAIYIDEANCSTGSRSLLSGAGYVKPDGTHGYGHDTLGMREQLKRTRQLFLDHGRRPMVWIPIYKKMIPHAYSFVDVGSEGEAYWETTRKDGGPDFIATWAGNLQKPADTVADNSTGAWLLSTSQSQKFGIIPVFLNYLPHWSTDYDKKLRSQYALLGLLDIIPYATEHGWFFKAKHDFGWDAPATRFHPYYRQREVRTDRDDVAVSYYRRGDRVLALVTNLGAEAYEGAVRFELAALGMREGSAMATRIDAAQPMVYNTTHKRWDHTQNTAMRRDPLEWASDGASLTVTIPSHDFSLIEVQAKQP